MSPSEISVTVDGARATVALVGEHEAYSADRLATQLDELIAAGVGVRVDLRRTEFVDSTVVGTLIAARRRAEARGLDLTLVLGPETGWPVRRLLDVTGLAEHFHVTP